MKLKNKVVVVTGASGGIGQASAIRLAKEGANLVLVGRNEVKLYETARLCSQKNNRVEVISFDLALIDHIPTLVSNIIKKFPIIDVLINSAGTYADGNPYESDLKAWDYVLDLNFRSVYHLTNLLLKNISSDEGAIINISSISGNITYGGGEIYSATKHALRAYSNCLFESVREKNIKVTNIAPGFVNTPMGHAENRDPKKMIQADDIAEAILLVLEMPLTACPTEITIRPQRSPYK